MKHVVIKYGGHALEDRKLNTLFCEDLAKLANAGIKFSIVHGGGPHISKMLARTGIESRFVNGLRVTDADTLEIVEATLCGQVNKAVTRLMLEHGLDACGISGEDGRLFTARQIDPELGHVGGEVIANPELPLCLMKNGFLPVIAPLALDNEGRPLNVNADTAAAALAASLKAIFILVSDVPGVLDSQQQLLSALSEKEIVALMNAGVITGGMKPKVEACLAALKNGAPEAIILDGRQPGSLLRFLAGGNNAGTRFFMA